MEKWRKTSVNYKRCKADWKTESINHLQNKITVILWVLILFWNLNINNIKWRICCWRYYKNISQWWQHRKFIAGVSLWLFLMNCRSFRILQLLWSHSRDRWKIWCHMQWFCFGINYRKIHSNSVGYKTDYEMFSMDFEEFLWAKRILREAHWRYPETYADRNSIFRNRIISL